MYGLKHDTINTAEETYGAFGLTGPLFGTLKPPAGARGVIINFLKSSLVIGCSDLKQ